jgi:hypothetical protein
VIGPCVDERQKTAEGDGEERGAGRDDAEREKKAEPRAWRTTHGKNDIKTLQQDKVTKIRKATKVGADLMVAGRQDNRVALDSSGRDGSKG